MNNAIAISNAIESALIQGDLSKLTSAERLSYFKNVCESLGLNSLTKPFEFITLNGKLTLYARKDATDQLRKIHSVSISISSREKIDDVYVVTARAKDKTGREDESTGAVNISGLKGDSLANAFMKAESKAKRRVTLSLCGLGLLDESEVADIPEIKLLNPDLPSSKEFPQEDIEPGSYMPKFGKFKGQTLSDIDPTELSSYMAYIEMSAQEQNKQIQGTVAEFMNTATEYLKSKDSDESTIPL